MQYRSLRGPISVQVEVTEICNLNCLHCYNHWRDKSNQSCSNSSLNQEKIGKIADSLIKANVSSVTLTGGEPLLLWKILPDAIQKMIANGINVGLNSNLSLLTNKAAIALRNCGLKQILVSILCSREEVHDSISGQKGSWQRTIDGIRKARKFGFHVNSNMVLTKFNFQFLRETAEFMKELGVTSFCATKASPALNARNFRDLTLSRDELRDSLNKLIQIKEELGVKVDILECYPLCLIGDVSRYSLFARRSCMAGVTSYTIGANGDVRPCSHADMIYGNLFTEDLIGIWGKMSDWRDGRYIPDECQACKFLEQCSGGCRMEAKYRGNIKGRDPFMSGPEDVKYSGVSHSSSNMGLSLPEKLKVNTCLKIREEDFGATLLIPGDVLFVNADAVQILRGLLDQREFTVNSVAEKFEIEVEVMRRFLHYLFMHGMIQSRFS